MCTNPAFTLVELLTGLAVIAVLIGISVPVLSRARGTARAAACAAHLRTLLIATHQYQNENADLLPYADCLIDAPRGRIAPLDGLAPYLGLELEPDAGSSLVRWNVSRCPADAAVAPTLGSSYVYVPLRLMQVAVGDAGDRQRFVTRHYQARLRVYVLWADLVPWHGPPSAMKDPVPTGRNVARSDNSVGPFTRADLDGYY